jgi:hypothetical protein
MTPRTVRRIRPAPAGLASVSLAPSRLVRSYSTRLPETGAA